MANSRVTHKTKTLISFPQEVERRDRAPFSNLHEQVHDHSSNQVSSHPGPGNNNNCSTHFHTPDQTIGVLCTRMPPGILTMTAGGGVYLWTLGTGILVHKPKSSNFKQEHYNIPPPTLLVSASTPNCPCMSVSQREVFIQNTLLDSNS